MIYFVLNHFIFLIKLDKWLSRPSLTSLPIGDNFWEPIFTKLYKSLKKQIKTKKQLTGALDQFVSGAQALPEGVASLNEYNEIIWANSKIQKMLGIKLPDDLNKPLNYIVRHSKFLEILNRNSKENSLTIVSGKNHYLIHVIEFGFDQKLIICRDIISEIQLENVRKQFISDVSHELKTPLTVLLGNAEILSLNLKKNTKDIELVNSLIEQSHRMNNLIKDLMTLSSFDSLNNNQRNEKISIDEIFKQINKDVKVFNRNKKIYYSFELISKKKLLGAKKEIISAVQNLISNAFRYTEKGYIKLSWYEEKYFGVICVKDTGIGIPKNHINKVTTRFHRVNSDRSRKTGGTGLGLAIVQSVMENHNGHIKIISDGISGSEFKLIFPVERTIK